MAKSMKGFRVRPQDENLIGIAKPRYLQNI